MNIHDRPAAAPLGSPVRLSLIIGICFVLMLAEGYDVQALGVAAPKLMPELGIAMAQRGALFGIGQWGVALGALLGGYCADRWDRRRMLMAAVAGFGIMTLATAFARDFNTLLAVRLAAGLGLGAAIPCVIGLALDFAPPARRVRTVTAIMAGLPLGGAIAAGVAAATMDSWGWRAIFYLGGGLPLILLALIPLLPAPQPIESIAQTTRPSFAMLFRDGRTRVTLVVWSIYFICLLVIYLLLNWLPTMMISRGVAHGQAQMLSVVFNLSAVAGNLALGVVTDRVGHRRTVPVIFALMTVAAGIVASADSYGAYLIGFAGLGFLLLGGQNCLNGVIPSFYPGEARALCVGSAVGVGRIGSIVGPLYAGFILAAGQPVQTVLVSVVALIALATGLVLLLNLIGRRFGAAEGSSPP